MRTWMKKERCRWAQVRSRSFDRVIEVGGDRADSGDKPPVQSLCRFSSGAVTGVDVGYIAKGCSMVDENERGWL